MNSNYSILLGVFFWFEERVLLPKNNETLEIFLTNCYNSFKASHDISFAQRKLDVSSFEKITFHKCSFISIPNNKLT